MTACFAVPEAATCDVNVGMACAATGAAHAAFAAISATCKTACVLILHEAALACRGAAEAARLGQRAANGGGAISGATSGAASGSCDAAVATPGGDVASACSMLIGTGRTKGP